MTTEECLRILHLKAGASPDQIRRAYLDLARVWHPDRFEGDQRLRGIAEDHLRKINEAYQVLKESPGQTTPPEYPESPPPRPARYPTPSARWNPRRVFSSLTPGTILRIGILALSLAAILLATALVTALHKPAFDAPLVASRMRAIQLPVLEPMSIMGYSTDPEVAIETLTDWAHGDIVNLWNRPGAPVAAPAATAPVPRPDVRLPRSRQPDGPLEPSLQTGAELIPFAQSGAGELRAVNNTSLEAIVFLVIGDRSAIRAIYLSPHSAASLQGVPTGIYTAQAILGTDIDAKQLKFRHAGRILPRFGPFEFWEVRSTEKTLNSRYEIKLEAEP